MIVFLDLALVSNVAEFSYDQAAFKLPPAAHGRLLAGIAFRCPQAGGSH